MNTYLIVDGRTGIYLYAPSSLLEGGQDSPLSAAILVLIVLLSRHRLWLGRLDRHQCNADTQSHSIYAYSQSPNMPLDPIFSLDTSASRSRVKQVSQVYSSKHASLYLEPSTLRANAL